MSLISLTHEKSGPKFTHTQSYGVKVFLLPVKGPGIGGVSNEVLPPGLFR